MNLDDRKIAKDFYKIEAFRILFYTIGTAIAFILAFWFIVNYIPIDDSELNMKQKIQIKK